MATHFSDVGFEIDEENFYDEMIKIFDTYVENSSKNIIMGNKGYVVIYLDDIELWFAIDEEKFVDIYDFEIHYNTGKWFEMKDPEWIWKESNDSFGLISVWEVDDSFPVNVTIPDALMCPDFKEDEVYKCQLSCFVESIEIFKNKEDFNKVHDGIAEKSFFPTGSFPANKDDEDFEQSSHAWINGIVENVEKKTNSYTNRNFYVVTVNSLDMSFDLLVADTDAELAGIEKGDIVSAWVWISGKIREK